MGHTQRLLPGAGGALRRHGAGAPARGLRVHRRGTRLPRVGQDAACAPRATLLPARGDGGLCAGAQPRAGGAAHRRGQEPRGGDGHREARARHPRGRAHPRPGAAVVRPATRVLRRRGGCGGRRGSPGAAADGDHLRLGASAHAAPGRPLRDGHLRRGAPPPRGELRARRARLPRPVPAGLERDVGARGRTPRRPDRAGGPGRVPQGHRRALGRLPGGLRDREGQRGPQPGRARALRQGAGRVPGLRAVAGHPHELAPRLGGVRAALDLVRRGAARHGRLPRAAAHRVRRRGQARDGGAPAAPPPRGPHAAVHAGQRHRLRHLAALPGASHHAPDARHGAQRDPRGAGQRALPSRGDVEGAERGRGRAGRERRHHRVWQRVGARARAASGPDPAARGGQARDPLRGRHRRAPDRGERPVLLLYGSLRGALRRAPSGDPDRRRSAFGARGDGGEAGAAIAAPAASGRTSARLTSRSRTCRLASDRPRSPAPSGRPWRRRPARRSRS